MLIGALDPFSHVFVFSIIFIIYYHSDWLAVVVQVVQLLFNALECAWHKFNQLSANNNDDNKISEVLFFL
jgi:hypothetical protein